jgi:hypothetical protein
VMENVLVSPVDEGTPQGGPLSPLFSNIVLDELTESLSEEDVGSAGTRTMLTSPHATGGLESG